MKLYFTCLAAVMVAALPHSAQAGVESNHATRIVTTRDLDLSRADHRKVLQRRIRDAATDVCRELNRSHVDATQQCIEHSIRTAQQGRSRRT